MKKAKVRNRVHTFKIAGKYSVMEKHVFNEYTAQLMNKRYAKSYYYYLLYRIVAVY